MTLRPCLVHRAFIPHAAAAGGLIGYGVNLTDAYRLSRGHAVEALAWTKAVMTRLGLTLKEVKTKLKSARKEHFDFLGYSFGPYHHRKDGHWYLGASPSKKSVRRLTTKVGELLVPGNHDPWPKVRDRLNAMLRGWSGYFSYGTRLTAYRRSRCDTCDPALRALSRDCNRGKSRGC